MSRMRGKPDLSIIMTNQKDPTAFLDGATIDSTTKAQPAIGSPTPATQSDNLEAMIKVQKIFRLRWDIAQALKSAAAAESSPFRRVTETNIVERLLMQHLKIDR